MTRSARPRCSSCASSAAFTAPSKLNEAAFNRAVDDVTAIARQLIGSLVTNAPPRDRDTEALKAKLRSAKRFDRV